MAKRRLTEDTPFLRTPDMYQIENDAPITEYSERSLDLIADAKNGGIPDGANAFCSVGKEKRGTVQMQLFAQIDRKPRPLSKWLSQPRLPRGHRLCYRARHDVARKTFEEALAITKEDILEALDGLPNGRKYTLTYAIEAVRAIIGDYLLRIKGCNLAQLNEVIRCESMCPNCLLTENCSLRDERVDQELREVGEIE